MKTLLLFLTFSLSSNLYCQDTLAAYNRYDGTSTLLINDGVDTFYVYNYTNGKLDSKVIQSSVAKKYQYKRYYPSGKLMWSKDMIGKKLSGISTFYSEKGKKVAEFNCKNDTIIDTLFMQKKLTLLFGKMTYSSVVYGGMMREDGTANISRSSGNRPHIDMYLVKMDSTLSTQKVYQNFRTDAFGDFFLCLEPGEFGFFDKRFDINLVQPSMGTPMGRAGKGVDANWNLNSPLVVKKNCYNFINLHYNSVGYAP